MIDFADGGDDLCRHVGVGAEAHAALFDVGAADVELDGGNLLQLVDLRCHIAVFLDRGAADVDDDIGV